MIGSRSCRIRSKGAYRATRVICHSPREITIMHEVLRILGRNILPASTRSECEPTALFSLTKSRPGRDLSLDQFLGLLRKSGIDWNKSANTQLGAHCLAPKP